MTWVSLGPLYGITSLRAPGLAGTGFRGRGVRNDAAAHPVDRQPHRGRHGHARHRHEQERQRELHRHPLHGEGGVQRPERVRPGVAPDRRRDLRPGGPDLRRAGGGVAGDGDLRHLSDAHRRAQPLARAAPGRRLSGEGRDRANHLRHRYVHHPIAMPGLLDGKTVLLTGATQGVGLQAALGIAKQSPTLVLVGRDAARTQAAVDQVKKATGNEKVSGMLADLSAQADVRRLAQEFTAQHRQLHVLFNNAGAIFQNRELTADGYERTFALNHLAPFLLTRLLRDLLVASAPARVITTSSGAHRAGKLNFSDLMGEKGYGAWLTYCTSKLANILFTRELARRL